MMKHMVARSSISTFYLLALCLVLTTCSSNPVANRKASALIATPTLAPTPTTTTPLAQQIPVLWLPHTVHLSTITGDGYTIGSPPDWTLERSTTATTSTLRLSSNTNRNASMLIETATISTGATGGHNNLAVQIDRPSGAKDFKLNTVSPTVTINDIQWDQTAATFDAAAQSFTVYAISTAFPGNANMLVAITYIAKTSEFDQVDIEDFQPMLRSFKFV